MKRPKETTIRQLGSVRADAVYPLRQFGRELDLHDKCLADAQKAGLRTVMFGRQKFVLGSDVIDFFRRLAEQQAGNNG